MVTIKRTVNYMWQSRKWSILAKVRYTFRLTV